MKHAVIASWSSMLLLLATVAGSALAAEPNGPGDQQYPGPRYLIVTALRTFTQNPDESWVGVGLSEELSRRLGTGHSGLVVLERPLVTGPDAVGKTDQDRLAAVLAADKARSANGSPGADVVLVGAVECKAQTLIASTRLVSAGTRGVLAAIAAEVPRSDGGLEHDVQSLAVDLTKRWCQQFGLQPSPQMTVIEDSQPGLYTAWCKAHEHLLHEEFEQCEAVATEALRAAPEPWLREALSHVRDLAYECLVGREEEGSPEWRRWVVRAAGQARNEMEDARRIKVIGAYYAGRALERAGDLKAAEDRYRECLKQRPGRLLWEFEGGGIIDTPVVVAGVAYAGCEDGRLRAFDAETGRVLWEFAGDAWVRRPVVLDGVVYAGSLDGQLRALRADTGRLLWSFAARGTISTPVVADGVAYAAAGSEFSPCHVYALDASSGKVIWDLAAGWDEEFGDPAVTEGVVHVSTRWDGHLRALDARTGRLLWDYKAGGGASAPVVAAGLVFAGSMDGHLRALDAGNGTVRWDLALGGHVCSPSATDGVLYACSGSEEDADTPSGIWALDARTGAVLWTHDTGGFVYQTPVVADGVLYAGFSSGPLLALDAKTGDLLWESRDWGLDTPLLADGVAYAGSIDGRFLAIDARSGLLLWGFDAAELTAAPVVADGVVYVGSHDRRMRAFATGQPAGIDLAERATTRLMACRLAVGRPGDALRLGARLWKETAGRGSEAVRQLASAARASWPAAPALHCGLRVRVPELPAPGEQIWVQDVGEETTLFRSPLIAAGIVYAVQVGMPYRLFACEAQSGAMLWEFSAEDAIEAPVVRDGTVIASLDDRIRALDSKTGAVLWDAPTDGWPGACLVLDDVITTGAGAKLPQAFDANTGAQLWRFDTEGSILAAVATDGVLCVISGSDDDSGCLRALDSHTGRVLWRSGESSVSAGGLLSATDGVAVVSGRADLADSLRAFEARTGRELWRTENDDSAESLVAADGAVYAGESVVPCLRALDARTGRELWRAEVGCSPYAPPVVVDGVVYAADYVGHLCAVSARTGAVMWNAQVGKYTYAPVVMDGVVYAGCGDGHLRAFQSPTGQLLWDVETTGLAGRPVAGDGVVCAVSWDGQLHVFDANRIKASPPPEATWSTDSQFWSYVIWGKGGLAARKVADGFALSQILKYDTWRSPDALADEIDRLAALGDWNGPEALAQDPATLCPPELDVDLSLRKQGIRPAAHFYARAAKTNDSPPEALEYAEEALRLAPRWKWLRGYVRELRLSTARAD